MGKNPAEKQQKERKKRKKRRGWKILGFFFLLFLLAVLTAGIYFYSKYGKTILSYYDKAKQIMREASREDFKRSQTSIIYATDGTVIKTLQSGKEVYYLPYKDIPEKAVTAMIVTEDKKFFSHDGVDYLANLRAAYSLVKHKGTIYQGGSTITQQLARNIYLTNEQTYARKLTEIFLAAELEKRYNKTEILEFYFNNIYFANGFYGIQAAAHGYFSKGVAELSLSELMFLCAIPNNPSLYDPYEHFEDTVARRDSVMEQMYLDGKLAKEEYDAACKEEIMLCPQEEPYNDYVETFAIFCAVRALMEENGFPFCYSFLDDGTKDVYLEYYEESYAYWQKELYHGGYRVYTSIDLKKQELLLQTVQDQLKNFDEKTEDGIYLLQGAATCVENETGRVVAIVGGRGENEHGYSLNRAYQSFRQPGSSIKPLVVYTPWLERGYFPDTIVTDEKFAGGPRNANGVYSGKITLRRAVEVSKNTVAWKLFEELTPEVGLSYVTDMQFRNIVPSDYVPAASLGGLTYGVCTLEMAGAYCALANDGLHRNPTCIVKITTADGEEIVGKEREATRIYEENAVRMMTDILQGVMTNGTGVKLQLKNSVSAGKTGTTNDIKDGWFVGYTPYYTTAVWVGYDMPKALDSLAGNTYPGYIWQTFMDKLHENLPKKDFTLYEDDRPVAIVDDALKEKEEIDVWNPGATPVISPTPVPEGDGAQEGDDGTENSDEQGNIGGGQSMSGEPGNENLGDGTTETGEPSGTPTPTLEPTPTTGWIEYDDDWWDAQMGEASGGYDDFYE
ncbi:MAG: transglycosylase domain-containing protein [Lachnospiraceae bacterium]|nr:transglycosylase domain-containing protein [Lachnospiraceae bacterium]